MNKLLVSIVVLVSLYNHPLHISITNLDRNEAQQNCVLAVKVFSDDFADRIRLDGGPSALIDRDTLLMKDKPFLTPYLKENLQIRLDGKLFPIDEWELDSIRNNFEASWLYYSLDYSGSFEQVLIHNTLFFDVFDDQKNLMILKKNKDEKAFQFTRKKPAITIQF